MHECARSRVCVNAFAMKSSSLCKKKNTKMWRAQSFCCLYEDCLQNVLSWYEMNSVSFLWWLFFFFWCVFCNFNFYAQMWRTTHLHLNHSSTAEQTETGKNRKEKTPNIGLPLRQSDAPDAIANPFVLCGIFSFFSSLSLCLSLSPSLFLSLCTPSWRGVVFF